MLGMRIAALRKNAGWNQAELARRLQISPSAVGMYEQGRREPSAQMLVDIARVFDVSLDYLMTGTPQPGERDRLEECGQVPVSSVRFPSRHDQQPCVVLAA